MDQADSRGRMPQRPVYDDYQGSGRKAMPPQQADYGNSVPGAGPESGRPDYLRYDAQAQRDPAADYTGNYDRQPARNNNEMPGRERDFQPANSDRQRKGRPIQPENREVDVDSILNDLERKVREAKKLPFSEQCVMDRYELLVTIESIRKVLPDDLKKAKWLLSQNRQLISESRKEAEKILREAEQQMALMIDDHEITQRAQEKAQELLTNAVSESRKIHTEAMEYAESMLGGLEKQLTEMLLYVNKEKDGIKGLKN